MGRRFGGNERDWDLTGKVPSRLPSAATEIDELDGVGSKNELLEGVAKMIGPGETGEGGVKERAKGEVSVGISMFRLAGRLGKGIVGRGGERG